MVTLRPSCIHHVSAPVQRHQLSSSILHDLQKCPSLQFYWAVGVIAELTASYLFGYYVICETPSLYNGIR